MKRRNLTKALAAVPFSCLVSANAYSQSKGATKQQEASHPFRSVNVPEDGRRVLFFFDFACPFCANYHEPLLNFTSTVPKAVQTLFIPVVNMADTARKQEQIIAAKCFYAASAVATKDQMARFAASVYDTYAKSRSLMSKEMWITAVKFAGIDTKRFVDAMKNGNNDVQIHFAARKTLQYALRATPSVGVGGKYVLTPDDVMGDQSMFFNILNGLTSEIL